MDFWYSVNNNTWMGRLDPRVKIVSLAGFIFIMMSSDSIAALLGGMTFIVLLGALAGISFTMFLKRLLWILPFGGVMAVILPFVVPGAAIAQFHLGTLELTMSVEGMTRAALLTLRMGLGIFAVTLLIATTGFGRIMSGLRQMHVPYVFVAIIEFTVRYINVLLDELKTMSLARKARGFESGRSFLHRRTFATLGSQVGVLFMRAGSRGERVYQAMLSRGYCGETGAVLSNGFRLLDIGLGLGILAVAMFLQVYDAGGWQWLISLK
ncbi:cobalt ECF transporter T component CbiQ [Desulfotruncus alcoholivorax]|uniref:cobalt ECF transporter T component CbiQ n=1 Tax=Desulfotruncus alcoholivorax TaxID=265477 RepID=UPI000487BA00|nr:cobalt ECF transporter T component CbiQ [Desulfotruncus alcoholivorax]